MIAAIQSFFSGMILETINRKNRQDFELKLIDTEKIKGLKKLGLFCCNNLKNLDGLEKAESLEVVGVDMDLAQKVRKLSSETGKKYVIIDYADYTIQGANYDDARGSWEDEYEILD